MKSGRFTEPESADYLRESFQEQASPIKKFIEDLCDVGLDFDQTTSEMYKYWCIWRKIKGYHPQNEVLFGKQLISADMHIKKFRKRKGGKRISCYMGVKLNEEKVEDFMISHVGKKEWDKAMEEYKRRGNADIIDIFEWSDNNKNK